MVKAAGAGCSRFLNIMQVHGCMHGASDMEENDDEDDDGDDC